MSSGETGRSLAPYGWAIGCVALTYLVRVGLDPFIGTQTPFVVLFFFPVIVGAWRGGVGPAIVAALLGLFLGDRVSMDFENGVPHVARVVRVGTFLFESWFIAWLFESRRLESRARTEAETIQRSILENLPRSAVFMFDKELRYIFATGSAIEEAGLDASSLIGRTHVDVYTEDEARRLDAPIRAALEGRVESVEVEFRGKTYLVRSAPLRNEEGDVDRVVEVAQEITDRKELERELREVQKLEAVGKLAGGVAHDFNNVLGVITASVDLLQGQRSTSAEQRKYLNSIEDATSRATALTQQLLDFSRRQVLQTEEVALPDVLQAVAVHLTTIVGDRAAVVVEQESGLPLVEVNRLELERAIVNLVTNARDAMTKRGTIWIRVRVRHSEAVANANAGDLVIEVSDDGSGMDATTLANTSKRFFTTKGKELGTGLGLSVVRSFVGSNRGKLEIESELGVGSTFRMVLPVSPHRTPLPGLLTLRPLPPMQKSSIRVLVVDDEDSIRSLTVQFLTARGFLVDEARDAESALADFHEDVEVVITDLFLPGMNGIEFGRRVRERNPNVRLVLVSGSHEVDAKTESLVEIKARFLPKPFHLRDLVALVESLSGPANSEEFAIEQEMFEIRRTN